MRPSLDQRHRGRKRHHRDLDVARDQRGVDLRIAAERHGENVDAGRMLDHLHRQVQRIADAARSVVELAWVGLGLGDQLLHRGDAGFRARHQDEVGGDELGHRREVVAARRTAGCCRARARWPRHWCSAGWCSRPAAISRPRRRRACRRRPGGSPRSPAGRAGRRASCRAGAPAHRRRRRRRTARSAGSGDWDRFWAWAAVTVARTATSAITRRRMRRLPVALAFAPRRVLRQQNRRKRPAQGRPPQAIRRQIVALLRRGALLARMRGDDVVHRRLHAALLVRDAGEASAISVMPSAPISVPSLMSPRWPMRKYLPA